MKMILLRLAFRLILAILIATFAGEYYALVLPPGIARAAGIGLAIVEFCGPFLMSGKSMGGSVIVLARIGLPLLIWPGLAWLARDLLGAGWYTRLALGSGVACAAGLLAARHGSGHESARLGALATSAVLPLYAIIVCLVGDAPAIAMTCAVAGVAVVPLVALAAGTWPGQHERIMRLASGACACVAAAWMVIGVI